MFFCFFFDLVHVDVNFSTGAASVSEWLSVAKSSDVLTVDRAAGTGWRPEEPQLRGAPGAAAPARKDPI